MSACRGTVAAGIDGVIMIAGAVYVVFFANDFLGPFQGFLITLGVPIAAWCGIFVADISLRRRDYAEAELYDRRGRYGSVRWLPIAARRVGTVVGWGLVTNTSAEWLSWQGYLLGPLGGKDGDWAFANLGVLVALLSGSSARWSRPRGRGPASGGSSRLVTAPALVVDRHAARVRRPGERWFTPGFAERRRPRCAGCCRRSATAWSSPGSSRRREPEGAWVPYYEQWPFALVPEDDPLYDLVRIRRRRRTAVVTATTFGKWGARASARRSAARTRSCWRASRPTAACSRRPSPPPTRACGCGWSPDACAGLSEADHRRALDAMALYAPLIEIGDSAALTP